MKGIGKYLAGVLLSAFLIWWFLHDVDFRAVGAALKQASWTGLVVCGLMQVGHNVFRVWRWQALLEPIHPKVPFRSAFTAVILGYMTTWIVPGRIGELVRPALLTAKERVPLGPCLGSVLTDRLTDAAAVVVLVALGAFVSPLGEGAAEHGGTIRYWSLVLVVVVVVVLAVLMSVNAFRERLDDRLRDRRGLLARLARTLLSVASGTVALRKPALVFRVALFSLLAWGCIGVGIWIGLLACGVKIDLGAVFILQFLLAVGVAIPTPGGAGTYHAAMKFGLVFLFAVPETRAVTAGILLHLTVVLPVILLGLALLWIDRISWKDLLAAAREVRGLGSGSKAVAGPPVEDTP